MKITYDRNVDAMMILFADLDIEETKDIAPGMYVDYDADGRVVALEILKASEKYDISNIESNGPNSYLSVSDVGNLFGISPASFQYQITNGDFKVSPFHFDR